LHKDPLLTICSAANHIVTGGAGREIQLISSPHRSTPISLCSQEVEPTPSVQQHTTLLNQPGESPNNSLLAL
jgi:hypothetical protein